MKECGDDRRFLSVHGVAWVVADVGFFQIDLPQQARNLLVRALSGWQYGNRPPYLLSW
jgi:hypothetical protein